MLSNGSKKVHFKQMMMMVVVVDVAKVFPFLLHVSAGKEWWL